MSDETLPPIEGVVGGSHGISAGWAQLLALAAECEAAAARCTERAGLGVRVMADADVLASGVLAPVTFAAAEAQVLDATTGRDGLTMRAAELLVDALAVRACEAAYELSDDAARMLAEALDHAIGRLLPLAALAAVPVMVHSAPLIAAGVAAMPPAQRAALARHTAERLGQLVHDHPDLVQHLVNGGGGLIDPFVPGPVGLLDPDDGPIGQATTSDAARLLALLAGHPLGQRVTRVTDDPVRRLRRPGSLGEVLDTLDDTAALDQPPDGEGRHRLNGAIRVQQLGEGDDVRHIVYLPGTDDMGPIPDGDDQARDMLGNYQLIGRLDSAYVRGVVEAMRDAGAASGPVMVVGHSQGGMVAAALAADPQVRAEFDIRQVVTAGSPTAQVPDLPASTHALHLENRGDVVPLLDGEPNPDQPHRVTVHFDGGDSDVAGNHAIDKYAGGARAAEAAGLGSVDEQLDHMRRLGFLGDGDAGTEEGTVRTYRITREQ